MSGKKIIQGLKEAIEHAKGNPPMQGESEITPSEVQRRWDLPYDHPESWVQLNATYRQIYARGYERGIGDAARCVEGFEGDVLHIAAAIRSLNAVAVPPLDKA